MIVLPIALVVIAFVVYDVKRSKSRSEELDTSGSSPRGVVLALGRFEGLQLLRHPAFFAGLGFVALGGVLLTRSAVTEIPDVSKDVSVLILLLFPLAGMTILAVSLMTLRARRDGTEELLASTPVSEDARAGGHLLTAAWAMAVAGACLAIVLVALYLSGAHGRPSIGELLAGPVLVGCAAAVGVSASRLVPSAAIGLIAVIAMGVFQGTTDYFSGPGTTRTSWFAPWVQPPEFIPEGIWPRRPWSHLVYLIGLGAFAAALGFLLRRQRGRRLLALGAALGLIAIGGIVQSRPFPVSASERAVAYVEHPTQVCRTLNEIEYCAYPEQSEMIGAWSPAVESVIRVLPATVRDRRLRVVQRVSPFAIYQLPGSALARLSPDTPSLEGELWQPDGAIHPDLDWCQGGSNCALALATQTASWAVGLPLDPVSEEQPDPYGTPVLHGYDSSGQARAVVALWLGARSSAGARSEFQRAMTHRPESAADTTAEGGAPFFVQGCEGVTEPGTQFAVVDGLFAKQLLDLPEDRVARVVNENWRRLTDPRTPSSAVVALFDLHQPDPAELGIDFTLCSD